MFYLSFFKVTKGPNSMNLLLIQILLHVRQCLTVSTITTYLGVEKNHVFGLNANGRTLPSGLNHSTS